MININIKDNLIFLLPLSILFFTIWLVQSSLFLAHPEPLAIGVTLDLILTVPIVYFFIIRKRNIPKITVVTVFVICFLIANTILPAGSKSLLHQVKTWGIPLVELIVLSYVIFQTRKIILQYRQEKGTSPDFYTAIKTACKSAFPEVAAELLAFEVSVIYFSLFAWTKRKLQPNEYTYSKKTGIVSIIAVFIFLVVAETFALHIFVQRWSTTVAFILSGLSVYTCFQLFALAKSLSQRPAFIDVEEKKLCLRYGFFNETTIHLEDIKEIIPSKRSLPDDNSIVKFSALDMLDSHNLILHLSKEYTLHRIYGMKKKYQSIAIWIDDKERFLMQMTELGIIEPSEPV